MRISKFVHGWLAASVLAVLLLPFSTFAFSTAQENPEVTRLLAQARDQAAVLSRDADDMEALTRSKVSWESHALTLARIKDDVNGLAKITEKLVAQRDSASPWQRQAIDRMLPLMRDLATNTTAAINHLNQNRTMPTTPDYVEYLKENDETAHQLADTISNFVQYGQTRAKMEQLEQKLEVAQR